MKLSEIFSEIEVGEMLTLEYPEDYPATRITIEVIMVSSDEIVGEPTEDMADWHIDLDDAQEAEVLERKQVTGAYRGYTIETPEPYTGPFANWRAWVCRGSMIIFPVYAMDKSEIVTKAKRRIDSHLKPSGVCQIRKNND